MRKEDRDYIFQGTTQSLCPVCLSRITGKLVIKDNRVYIKKSCSKHGDMTCLIEEDAGYYLSTAQYNKPGTKCKTQTKIEKECPFDCGLCPDHEQHSCINVIDITNNCDLGCPTCYASSGSGDFLSLERIEKMIDFAIDSEYGEIEILQISGGEPTTHPAIIEILKLARTKKIKYLMLNTNGINIAENENLAKELSELGGCIEVYLQFDGFKDSTYQKLRGRDLLETKKQAIRNLTKYKVPIALVATIQKGVNDDEIGEMIKFGLETKHIRGINFQPVSYFGRLKDINYFDRSTLSGVINHIEKQTKGLIKKSDFVPLPCHPDKISITYLHRKRKNGKFIPITRDVDIRKYLSIMSNTIFFKTSDILKKSVKNLWSASTTLSSFESLKDFSCCVPLDINLLSKKERLDYVDENTFRVSIVSFLDAYNFDTKSIKQECVHFITPELKKIPFSTYNILYRESNHANKQ